MGNKVSVILECFVWSSLSAYTNNSGFYRDQIKFHGQNEECLEFQSSKFEAMLLMIDYRGHETLAFLVFNFLHRDFILWHICAR